MILKTRHTIRKATAVAVLAAAMLVGLTAQASPADAAFNATLENVSSTTSCNSSTRTITFGASIMLTGAYANGAYVSHRFRYFKVNPAGARTSAYYGGNWLGPRFVNTWTTHAGIMGPIAMNSPVHLSGGSLTLFGQFDVEVEIAVWTGRSYVYSGWLDIVSFDNFYPTSLGMERTELSSCLTVW